MTRRDDDTQLSLPRRLLWFVMLWLGGVGAVSLVAYGLRLWIAPH